MSEYCSKPKEKKKSSESQVEKVTSTNSQTPTIATSESEAGKILSEQETTKYRYNRKSKALMPHMFETNTTSPHSRLKASDSDKKSYLNVINSIDNFNNTIKILSIPKNISNQSGIEKFNDQYTQILDKYIKINTATQKYIDKNSGFFTKLFSSKIRCRLQYINFIRNKTLEDLKAIGLLYDIAIVEPDKLNTLFNDPDANGTVLPRRWVELIPLLGIKSEIRNESIGSDRGAQNLVQKHELTGKKTGFFKSKMKGDFIEKIYNRGMYANQIGIAHDLLTKLNTIENYSSSKRDVAMSRLASLLGLNIIAGAERVKVFNNGRSTSGSMMEEAQGSSGTNFEVSYNTRKGDTITTNSILHEDNNHGSLSVNDPKLQKYLSQLQILDTLAFMLDRHHGNIFFETDNSGKVKRVTGIDNDISFGNVGFDIDDIDENDLSPDELELYKKADEQYMKLGKNSITHDVHKLGFEVSQELPGLTTIIDEEIANKIIHLDSSVLRYALFGLLKDDEMDALCQRLTVLKLHMLRARNKGNLIKEEDWGEAIGKRMLAENSEWGANNFEEGASNYLARILFSRKLNSNQGLKIHEKIIKDLKKD